MILKRLRLENIRSYTNGEISFPEGSLMLSGDVGAGKSSVLLAVEFALFGLLKGQLSGEALLRNGANQGSVLLKMEIDGKDVVIKRGLKRAKHGIMQDTGYLVINGEKTESTPTELKVKVLELLGYPQELITKSKLIYRYTVYTPQEEMKQILSDEKDMRLDTLRKVFGVDKYKRIIENASIFLKQIRVERRALKEKTSELPLRRKERAEKMDEFEQLGKRQLDIEPRFFDVKHLVENKKEDIAKIEKNIAERERIVKKREIEDVKLDENVKHLEKNRSELARIEEEMLKISEKISKIDIRQMKMPSSFTGKEEELIEKDLVLEEKELQKINDEQLTLNEKIRNLKSILDEMQKDIESKTESTSSLAKKKELCTGLIEAISEKDALRNRMERLENDLQTTLVSLKEAETHRKNAEEMINNIVSLNKCPTCLQEIATAHKHRIKEDEMTKLNTHKDMTDLLEKKKKKMMVEKADAKAMLDMLHEKEKEFEKLKSEIDALEKTRKEVADMQKRFSVFGMEHIKLENRKQEIGGDDISIKRQLLDEKKQLFKLIKENNFRMREKAYLETTLNEKEKHLERIKTENEQIRNDIKHINVEKLKLNDALSAYDEIQKTYDEAKEDLEQLLLKERQLEIAMAELKKEAEGIKKILTNIHDAITKLTLAESRLERLTMLHDWLETHFIRLIENMEKHVMLRAHAEFNEMFAKWFGMLIEDEAVSVRLDEQFSPVIVQNGYETDVSNLSGGEKTSIALAYRLALNKVINDVIGDIRTKNIIILDEPTDGFSSYQLDRIKDVLEELDTKQVIIVSHESKIESFVENVLRITKNDHMSQVLS
ncbi:MAG: SMC family ATPase [Nanoarchaeota archaeon]|nr:SMC family ATPase [Nanoarchaeota archaeon]